MSIEFQSQKVKKMAEGEPKKKGKIAGFLKGAFKAAVWGAGAFYLGGLADFALFHNNPGGEALVNATNGFFQGMYNWLGLTDLSFGLAEFFNGVTPGPDPTQYGQDLLAQQTNMFPR